MNRMTMISWVRVDMFELFPLVILLLSGTVALAFNFFKIGKYGVITSAISFIPLLFLKPHKLKFNWFSISNLNFDLSFNFWESEILICLIITMILICLYQARSISFFDNAIERKFGVLNIFVFFMCLAVLSDNIFQFYIGVEALGLISTILVSIEKNSEAETTRVFFFNKFASILFLVAISLLVITTNSFDISKIMEACSVKDSAKLLIPASLLLIACLCKGAQLPFSYWLLDAVKANTFASILIHAGTIVAVGIIFITKFYFLFDCFPILKKLMIVTGLFTSFWMVCCALVHNDIKKIIACLTSSSAGMMFIACGFGGYSLAILYFICHAFFKSMLFLSFAYLIAAMSGERDLSHLGGIAKMAPKVTDIIWVSFLFAAGFPFFSGFFSKISFMGTMEISEMRFISWEVIAVSILSIAAIFRMILKSLYEESRSDDLTLSRASKSNDYDMKPFWFLSCIATFGSFMIWSVFEWGDLHFGKAGIVYIRETMDYFHEIISSLVQIAIAVVAVCFYEKYSGKSTQNEISLTVALFRRNEIYGISRTIIRRIITFAMRILNSTQKIIVYKMNKDTFKTIYRVGNFLASQHRSFINSHAIWILLGITTAFALALFEGMFK